MKNPDPLEKDIEKRVCDYAKSLKMLVYKFTSPSRRSVPDRMFITQAGVVFFIEFKRKGQKPTAAQEVEIAKIRATGNIVGVIDNVDDGKKFITQMSNVKRAQFDPTDPHFYDNLIIQNHLFAGKTVEDMLSGY
jgi:hypothetical protein